MKIKVSDIEDVYKIKYKEDSKSFYDGFEEVSSGEINIKGPVSVDAELTKKGGSIFIKGSIKGDLELNCSRCLCDFDFPFEEKIDLTLLQGEEKIFPGAHDVELTDEDLRTELFTGEDIDISKIVQEQLILACPINPVCKDDCKGLCPVCGNNLNEQDCKCERIEESNPFSVLKDLK